MSEASGFEYIAWLAMSLAEDCQPLLGIGNASAISEFSDAENASILEHSALSHNTMKQILR